MAKVLVIDDDATIRFILKKILETSGYDVIIATNGEEGIKQAESVFPDLIICDWTMPLLDGLEVCKYIKNHPKLSLTYFILLTMRDEVSDRVKGLDSGADDYLPKPINMHELQARVRSGLRLKRLTQELQEANQALSEANQQLVTRNELLESLSLTDQLTGLLNRRAMDQALPHILKQVGDRNSGARYRYLCALMIDVDYFKKINDTYGHPVGDKVLMALAGRLKNMAHPSSLLYRYGGEELLCITPGLNPKSCIDYSESLRMAIASHPIQISEELVIPITVSIGGAIASEKNLVNYHNLLQQADQALYQAKREGRNCVRIALTGK